MLKEFCNWLAATQASQTVQDIFWIIPTTQTIHILSITVVMSSMVLLDLRLLGVAVRGQPMTDLAQRFLPWTWVAIVVLACTGAILIVGEPGRELQSQIFWIKMSLLVAAMLLMAIFQAVLRRNSTFWDRNRGAAVAFGAVSLVIWVGIVAAGRWIAYVEHG